MTDTVRAALGYWYQLISDAARAGFTVTDTVQLANQVAHDLGGSLRPDENRAISQLYGYVRREINAGNALQAASPDAFISEDMMSTPPYARVEQEQTTYPTYHVRFSYTHIDQAGNIRTEYKTDVIPDVLPATIAELQAEVEDAAAGMAAKYGHSILEVQVLNILVV